MENPNVNNLNGVPNFGHGFDEAASEDVVPTVAEEPSIDEVKEDTETEMKAKKKKQV